MSNFFFSKRQIPTGFVFGLIFISALAISFSFSNLIYACGNGGHEGHEKPVLGCTDPNATNYNKDATKDDGSCEYPEEPILGCMDPKATNYDVNATQDNGSCEYPEEPEPSVATTTIIATKIVCESESSLPNWSGESVNITSSTASDYVASHEDCHLESGWEFQWGTSNASDPGGSFIGMASDPWTTFSSSTDSFGLTSVTIQVPDDNFIWIREILRPDYLSFTGEEVSAEIYCHTDVLNYDNYDFVNNIEADHTYYCVAFNVFTGDNEEPKPEEISISLTANPTTINKGQSSDLTWTSVNTNECSADWTIATSTSGVQTVSPEGTTIYSIACGNGTATSTATTTVTVNIPTDNSSGGGDGGNGGSGDGGGDSGGGSSRSSRGDSRNVGVVAGATIDTTCFYLRDYLRRDLNNDRFEVLKLQAFLINFEGHNEVALTGVFDQATFDAVSSFQMKYFKDILEPWGHTGPTGYVYILTKKKINEIYCQHVYPLTQAQLDEIVAYRALIENLGVGGGAEEEVNTPSSTTTTPVLPIVGESEPSEGQILSLAAAMFATPDTLLGKAKCLYEIILIIIVLYILGSILKDVFCENIPKDNRKRFLIKWSTVDIGLIIAIVTAYMLEWLCLILPLILALILTFIWTLTYSKHNSIRASTKSWYLVGLARTKSILKETKETLKEPTPIKEQPTSIVKEESIEQSIKKEPAPNVIFIEPKVGPKIEPKIEPKTESKK